MKYIFLALVALFVASAVFIGEVAAAFAGT